MTQYNEKELLIIKLVCDVEQGITDEQDLETLREVLEDAGFPYTLEEVIQEAFERELLEDLKYDADEDEC